LTSPWSRLLLGTLSFVTAAWVLSLVRRGKLYVGYGLPFLALAAAGVGLALLPTRHPDLVGGVRAASGWLEAALVLAAFGIAVMFVYVLSQLTIIAGRTARLAQELALRDAARVARKGRNESSTPLRGVRADQPAGRPRS
jgi:hypothetical protein